MVEYLKIPEEKIEVLLKDKEKIKKQIEKATKTKLNINTELNEVEISETSDSDPLLVWKACDLVKALGRGFEPEVVFRLVEEDAELRIIDIKEHIGKSKKAAVRIKGRIIGTEGKARRTIEALTDCYVSIYGRTVSIIGNVENVQIARRAVEGLLKGSKHGNIYKWLEKRRKEVIQKKFEQSG